MVTKQTDFSAGEVDAALKRSDDVGAFKTGARQARNWRILNSRGLKNRPGRRVLFLDGPRVEELSMAPGQKFYLVFAHGFLRVYNSAGAKVYEDLAPWTTANVGSVVWDIYKFSIYICFPGMQPRVLTWDGVSQTSTWSGVAYGVDIAGGQKRTAFYRISQQNVRIQPSAAIGAITITFSENIATGAFTNTRIRYINSQIFITGVPAPNVLTGIVQEPLHPGVKIFAAAGTVMSNFYQVDDVVIGSVSGAKGIVIEVGDAFIEQNAILVQQFTATPFAVGDNVVGQHGAKICTATDARPPQMCKVWDNEVMNNTSGFPASCFVDQGRLGFCDFPNVPGLVVWSAIGSFFDLYTDEFNATPSNAIQEIVPGKSRVYYVMPGVDSSEFVFCDNAVYYINIDQANPLRPGSVSFSQLTADGAAQVKPSRAQQSLIYISAGRQQIKAIQAIGSYSRPYVIDDLSDLHGHLLNSPFCIAIPTAADQFEERYIYALNADGSITVGKYKFKNGLIDTETLGWVPWSGSGTPTWVSALDSALLISNSYAPNGIAAVKLVEVMDDTQYLDCAMRYNSAPVALAPPLPGLGPLWWMPSGTVDLMDGPLGTRMMGTYNVDTVGFLIPQNNGGEDLTSATLVVGQTWTATMEPFIPAAGAGQNMGQRMWPRRLHRVQVYVQDSTGFVMARLFGAPATRTSPAPGTVMTRRRITAWNQDDDPTQPPTLREKSYLDRPIGHAHDPRWAIIKDTPGPLTILELDTEVSI